MERSNAVVSPRASRPTVIAFAVGDLLTASLLVAGVFFALPLRDGLVDAAAVLMALSLAVAGVSLLVRSSSAEAVSRAACGVVLAIGLLVLGGFAISASYLYGVYDQIGRGGAMIFGVIILLAMPYLVGLPAAQLIWLGPKRGTGR